VLEIFDQDKDGYLDEDEQILIFSVVKTKLQIIAEALCDIHNYAMYKALMVEVRDIEGQVVEYQDRLRCRIYQKQLEEYKDIGDQMTNDERNRWNEALKNYQQELVKKVELLEKKQQEDEETLKRALEHPSEAIKYLPSHLYFRIKSIPKLRELQCQEKLVAINERVEEAMNYRKELKVLEEQNEKRKKDLKESKDEKARQKLLEVKHKELSELEAKIQANKRLLERTREIQMDIVNKKINLHVKDIERMQGLLCKYAKKKGKTEDELKRVRDNARKTMKVMGEFKRVNQSVGPTGRKSPTRTMENEKTTLIHTSNPFVFTNKKLGQSSHSSMDTTALNNPIYKNIIEPLQRLAKSVAFTRFNIRSTVVSHSAKPINQQDETMQGGIEKKIKALLGQRKKVDQGVPSIADQYDEDLNPLPPPA
jgi:hypothetical protein